MTGGIQLREVREAHLPIFFAQQLDAEANRMAAFTAKDPADREAFAAHWAKILCDPAITIKTILFDGRVAGHVLSHRCFGEPEVSYWLGREYWGQGIATKALAEFLVLFKTRPLYARAAEDNIASRRILEKCGFKIHGEERGFANARGEEIVEVIMVLLD